MWLSLHPYIRVKMSAMWPHLSKTSCQTVGTIAAEMRAHWANEGNKLSPRFSGIKDTVKTSILHPLMICVHL